MKQMAIFNKFARKRKMRAGNIVLTLVGTMNLTTNANATSTVVLKNADEYAAVKNCLPKEAKFEAYHGLGGYKIAAAYLAAAKAAISGQRKALAKTARSRAEKVRKDFAVLRGMIVALVEYGKGRFLSLLAKRGENFFARLAMRWASGNEVYSVATAGYKPVTLGDLFSDVLNNLRTR